MFKINKQIFYQFLLLSFIIYGPVLMLTGLRIDFRIFVIGSIFFIYFLYMLKKKKLSIVNKEITYSLFVILIIILLYTLSVFIRLEDTYFLNLSVKLLLFFIFVLIILDYLKDKKMFFKYYFDYIFYATTINSLIILLMASNETIRSFIQSYQLQIKLLQVSGDLRMMALNGLAGSTLSLYTFFGFIAYFYTTSKSSIFKNLSMLIILISFLYSGKTGLIFVIIFLFITIFKYLKNKIGYILAILSYILFLFIVLLASNLFVQNLYLFSQETINTFRFLSSMYTSKSGLPFTVEALLFHSFFIPTDNILLGSIGFNNYNGGPLHSDIGYIKMLFSIGVIGQLLFSLLYLYIGILSFYYSKNENSFNYSVLVVIFIFIFHLKGLSLGLTLATFILFLSFFVSYKKMKYNLQTYKGNQYETINTKL